MEMEPACSARQVNGIFCILIWAVIDIGKYTSRKSSYPWKKKKSQIFRKKSSCTYNMCAF